MEDAGAQWLWINLIRLACWLESNSAHHLNKVLSLYGLPVLFESGELRRELNEFDEGLIVVISTPARTGY